MNAEDYSRRTEEVAGWPVTVESYRIGDRYYCMVDNVDPGARVARAEGETREEAERVAVAKAAMRLAATRRRAVE